MCRNNKQFVVFKQTDTDTQEHTIYLEFVPAFKVMDLEIGKLVAKICNSPDFRKEFKATDSFLVVVDISFIETEA